MGEFGIFLVILAIFIVAENPWLLIIAGVVVVLGIIIAIKSPSSGGSSSSGGYSSYTSGSSTASSYGSGTRDNGFLWEGRYKMDYDPVIATFRNGHVFEGYDSGLLDFSEIKASYRDGYVYDGSIDNYLGTILGRYENTYIYRGNSTFFSDCIARYEDGKIYRGNSTSFASDVIGTYEGDDDGAAAAAIVYLLE